MDRPGSTYMLKTKEREEGEEEIGKGLTNLWIHGESPAV